MSQHQSSGVTPAPVNAAKDILVELFPQAGVYHITGKMRVSTPPPDSRGSWKSVMTRAKCWRWRLW
eukprot:50425-Eustigmatos_ZCMA.PRE.1